MDVYRDYFELIRSYIIGSNISINTATNSTTIRTTIRTTNMGGCSVT